MRNFFLSKKESTNRNILKDGADDRTRTGDLLITNELLYQLSYVGPQKRLGKLLVLNREKVIPKAGRVALILRNWGS